MITLIVSPVACIINNACSVFAVWKLLLRKKILTRIFIELNKVTSESMPNGINYHYAMIFID